MSLPQPPVGPYGQQPGNDTPQPGQGVPQQGYEVRTVPPAYVPRPINGKAITALVLSILGITALPVVPAIVGIILGHIARAQIRRRNQEGAKLALAALIIGYIVVGLFAAGLLTGAVLELIY